MAEEQFFSLPNVFWFAAGLGAEVVFLGLGVSPTGMSWGAEIAEALGMVPSFNDAASLAAVTEGATAAPAVASTGVEVLSL